MDITEKKLRDNCRRLADHIMRDTKRHSFITRYPSTNWLEIPNNDVIKSKAWALTMNGIRLKRNENLARQIYTNISD